MASVGSFTVTLFRIPMPHARRPFARLPPYPGVANYVLVRGPSRIELARGPTAVQVSSRAAAQSLRRSYEAAIGTVVTVVDQFGEAFPQCTILDVDCHPSDILGGARLDAFWSIDVPLA